jgi:carbonic anhydrase/acetyltransferase-like protein (isoleucine patch superfamily)
MASRETRPADSSRPAGTPPSGDRVDVHPRAWIAPGAILVGEVSVGEDSSVWYGCVLRGDLEPVRVGAATNIQDLTVVHVDRGNPAEIGNRVTIGHRAIVHGCVVEDDVLVGMGAVLLTGCRIGNGSFVAAGAVVREGFEVPPGSLVAGVPARVLGPVTDDLRGRIAEGVREYLDGANHYREGRLGRGPYGGGDR